MASDKSFATATFNDLKQAYSDAVEAGMDTFAIGGIEFYVGYAKYLIEYLESRGVTGERLIADLIAPRRGD
jgi:hypothetical protein